MPTFAVVTLWPWGTRIFSNLIWIVLQLEETICGPAKLFKSFCLERMEGTQLFIQIDLEPNYVLNMFVYAHRHILSSPLLREASFSCACVQCVWISAYTRIENNRISNFPNTLIIRLNTSLNLKDYSIFNIKPVG